MCKICDALGQVVDEEGNIVQVQEPVSDEEMERVLRDAMAEGVEGRDWGWFGAAEE